MRIYVDESIKHCCGAAGYNPSLGDTCPACQVYADARRAQAHAAIEAAMQTPELQLAIARAADVCVPDVREWLKGRQA